MIDMEYATGTALLANSSKLEMRCDEFTDTARKLRITYALSSVSPHHFP